MNNPDGRLRKALAEIRHEWYRKKERGAGVYECPHCRMWTANEPMYFRDVCPACERRKVADRRGALLASPLHTGAEPEKDKDEPVDALPDASVRRSDAGHIGISRSGVRPSLDVLREGLLAVLDVLRQKKFPLVMHGHSTCAADPDVVLWKDIEAALSSSRTAPEQEKK